MKNKPANLFNFCFFFLFIFLSVLGSCAGWFKKTHNTLFESKVNDEVTQESFVNSLHDVDCRNPLLSGSDCSQYACINFGHSYLEESISDAEVSCICPPGSYGTHCEPINCPYSQMTYNSPVDRSLVSFITYNKLMKKMDNSEKTDEFINQLVKMAGDSSNGYTSVTCGVSCAKKTPIWQLTSFEQNNKKLLAGLNTFINLIRKGNSTSENFKLSDIYQLVALSQAYSDVNIFTNMGITDDLGSIDEILSLIKQTALANRIRINIFVVSQLSTKENIYYQKAWKPLIGLSETTGGFVIIPYDIFSIFNSKTSTITESIEKLFPIFNQGRSILKKVLKGNVASFLLPFKLPLDSQNKRIGYLFIFGDSAFDETLLEFNVISGSIENYFILNNLKIYKISFPSEVNSPFILITNNLNISLNVQLLSSTKESFFNLGYTINDLADSSSPLPIIDVPNTVVGRSKNINGNVTLKLNNSPNIQSTSLNNIRNGSCYFNYQYMTVISTTKDISYFTATSDIDDYQEWIPFTFSDSSLVPFTTSDIVYFRQNELEKITYLLDNKLINHINFDNIEEYLKTYDYYNDIKTLPDDILPLDVEEENLENDDTLTTIVTSTTQFPIDNNSQRSFSLAFYSRTSLVNELVNQPRTKSLTNRLKQFFAKFSNNYDSFIFASFYQASNPNLIQAVDSTTYGDFLSDMMNRLSSGDHDNDTCFEDNSVQQVLIKTLQSSAFERSSDIYLITDQLYGKIPNDKQFGDVVLYDLLNKLTPRINILLVESRCSRQFEDINFTGLQPYWELTKRTGGVIIRVQDSSSLLDWFSYLTTQNSSKYENIYSDNQPGQYSQKKDGSNSFTLTNGHTYTIFATIQTIAQSSLPTAISILDQNNNSICSGPPLQTIEEEFGISSPCTIQQSGKYYVQLNSNYFPSETFQVRVVEFNADYGYKLSFTDSKSNPSDSPLYGVATPITISFHPYNEKGINEIDSDLTVTIYDSTQKTVFNSKTYSGGSYLYHTNSSWLCSNANKMYYIQVKSQKDSRIFSYTCLDTNDGTNTPDLQCPPWINQTDCSTPICSNGGTLIEGVCSCPLNYTGTYCEHYIYTCTNDNDIYYNDYTTSLIFVIDLQNDKLDDLKNQFKYIESNMDDYGQKEYMLFTYDSGSNISPSNMNIYITSEKKKFFYELSQLNSISGGITTAGAYTSYLKSILSRQSGSKSVLIWIPHRYECSTEIDTELVDLILKKNVDLRMIYYNQILAYCEDIAYYIMLGNGLYTKYTSDTGKDDTSFGYYVVNGLLSSYNNTGLIVYDSYFTYDDSSCTQTVKTKIINDGINEVFVTIDGLKMDSNTMNSATKLATNIYSIDMTGSLTKDIVFTCEMSTTIRRGYIIEAQSPTKIAFGYTSTDIDSFKNFAPISSITNNYIYFNIENCLGSDKEFIINYPRVTNQYISPKKVSPKETFSFVNRRDNCTNKWVGKLSCSTSNSINSLLRIKITGKNDNNIEYSKVVTTVCRDKVDCKNEGVFSSTNGLCSCEPSWIGQDCSTPKCYNGYTVNNQQCLCDKDWYGSHCNNNSPVQPTGPTITSTTITTSTIDPQTCYDKLNITLVLIFDETSKSLPYVSNYIDFYSSFKTHIKSYGPNNQINLAAEFASLNPIMNSFVDISHIANFINNTRKTDGIDVDSTFNSDISLLLSMCNDISQVKRCDPKKNKYFIVFGASNDFVNDNCVSGSLSFLNGIKSIVFTYGDAVGSNSWWNTCYKTETNDPSGNNIKIYDGSSLATDSFTTAMLDICRLENLI